MSIIRRAILALVLMTGTAPAFAQAPAPVPALPDAERRTSYSITASTCQCAVNMALYGDSTDYQNWLEVWINGVNAAYNDPVVGWKVTSPSGPLANLARPISNAVLTFNGPQTGTIQIVGARRPRRVAQFAENTGVPARNLNQAITDLVAQNREAWDRTNDIAGRAPLLPPGETMGTLPPLAGRANMGACFDSNGRLAPCVAAPSGSFVAGAGIQFTGTNPTTISATLVGNPNTVAIASRAAAVALDLHTYSVVTTGGYGVGGDGGSATFQNVGSSPFKDSYILTGNVSAGGSNYGAATSYLGVRLTGGSLGLGCMGKVTVNSSAAVSAIDISGTLCPNYQVGDVLAPLASDMAPGGLGGSGATYTITSVSAPLGSFTDSVGTHFQYVVGSNGFPNARQFGCKLDWNGNDGVATNDLPCFNSAIAFAMLPFGSSAALVNGNTIIVPKGAAYLCAGTSPFSTLIVPAGVALAGAGSHGGTTLKQCAAENSAAHFVTLCDPNAQLGQFGCKLQNLSLSTDGPSSNAVAAVYSNSGQQFPLLENVYIETTARGCVYYEIGKGGAANAIFNDLDCEQDSGNTNVGLVANSSNTQIILNNSNFGCAPSNCAANAITLASNSNGVIDKFHIEHHVNAMSLAATGLTTIRNGTITTGCVNGITLTSSNANGTVLVENVQSSCTTTVVNGHSGGAPVTGNILAPLTFNP